MRIVLFTGKGGVGKTTVASATALRIASTGLKTLVMSTDPAHSLADALGTELGPDPTEVATNLWAEQIDPQRRLEENWREIQDHAVNVLQWAGLAEVEAEELSVIPGLDELFSLADVKRHHDEGPYDVLIVDCAPTGETLRLLSLPDIIQWYMERVYPIERRVVGALRPMARRLTSLPLPDDNVYAAVRRFYDKLEGVRRVLTDPATTSVRLVVNPERMVIAEAQRTFTYLNLFGYRVDCIVANRLLPEEVTDPYFARWKEIQAGHMTTIQESFDPVPILRAHLRDRELSGAELLLEFGDEIYADRDPAAVLFTDEPMSITKRGSVHVLTLHLPFTNKADLELSTKNDELFVKVGPYRRTIMLPNVLASRRITSAGFKGDRLEITFERSFDG
ncbi:MAG: arsenite/tail-anchored protein-transporting ATPase [Actinomycetota bacterium]|jgi:arsenite-transporting ATPase|nr:arsenite/tail-anchored protein-transporting ATPase [Actinomycetota bacterium]